MDGDAAGIMEGVGKAHIGRGVDEQLFARRGESLERGAQAAQHAVFIANVLRFQSLCAVAGFVPVDDGVVVELRQLEIAEVRHLHALSDRVQNRGRGGKGHVRNPHGDHVEARVGLYVVKGDFIRRKAVMPRAVENGGKVVFHL